MHHHVVESTKQVTLSEGAMWRPCNHSKQHITTKFEREMAILSFSLPLSLFTSTFKLLCNFFIISIIILTAEPAGEDGGGQPTAASAPSSPTTPPLKPQNTKHVPDLILASELKSKLAFSKFFLKWSDRGPPSKPKPKT